MANKNKVKPDNQFTFYIQKEKVEDFGVVFVPRKKQQARKQRTR